MTYVKNASGTSRWSSPQRVNHRGWSIGKNIRVKRLPVVVLPIAIPQAHSLAGTSRRFSGAMKSTSPLCAKAATIAQTTSGLTPNWLEYQRIVNLAWYATPQVLRSGIGRPPHCFSQFKPYCYEERDTHCF